VQVFLWWYISIIVLRPKQRISWWFLLAITLFYFFCYHMYYLNIRSSSGHSFVSCDKTIRPYDKIFYHVISFFCITTEYWMIRKRCWKGLLPHRSLKKGGQIFDSIAIESAIRSRARSITPVLPVNASSRLENNLYVPPSLPTYVGVMCVSNISYYLTR